MNCPKCGHPVFIYMQYNPPRFLSGNGEPHSKRCDKWTRELAAKTKREMKKNQQLSFSWDSANNNDKSAPTQDTESLRGFTVIGPYWKTRV